MKNYAQICQYNAIGFCQRYEPNFVKELGQTIVSDHCCDKKSCKSVCFYNCLTLEKKMESFQVYFLNEKKKLEIINFSIFSNRVLGMKIVQ